MESQIKSSFIPEDTAAPVYKRPAVGTGGDLITLLGVIAIVASLTLAGAVFLYQKYLENSLVVKQQSIERARAAIEPALITELSRLDARMKSADSLLGAHISSAALLAMLGQITLQSVEWTELSMTTEAQDSIKLNIRGLARSVNAIALQSDLLGKSGVITSPIFSDISRGGDGFTRFRVDAQVSATALRYRSLLTAAGASSGAVLQQETQQTTTDQQQASSSQGGTATSTTPTASQDSGTTRQ